MHRFLQTTGFHTSRYSFIFKRYNSMFSLSRFPATSVVISYGSQAVHARNRPENGLCDYIFVVPCVRQWHVLNRKLNPQHYPILLSNSLSSFLHTIGAGVVYLIDVEMGIKYGVVDWNIFCSDLINWDTFFFAGRMQKPVSILHSADKKSLQLIMQQNYQSAHHTALLLLDRFFTMDAYLTTICGMSYYGDVRMLVGAEHPRKLHRLVSDNYQQLMTIYSPFLMSDCRMQSNDGVFEQSVDSVSRWYHMSHSPLRRLINKNDYSPIQIRNAIASVSRRPSIMQACQGLLTVSPITSLSYAFRKLRLGYCS